MHMSTCPRARSMDQKHLGSSNCEAGGRGQAVINWVVQPLQLWPWLLSITGYFYGVIHSIDIYKCGFASTYTWSFGP